ncbi:MAG: hypothetical protein KIS66_15355 [Fimbriimonadaceae bacterium]|nr:hypothetical protein [Fimbriimonadaceae bacterium]
MSYGVPHRLAETLDRFESWWFCLNDRPIVQIGVETPAPPRPITNRSPRDEWLDLDARLDEAEARLAATPLVGDNLPVFFANMGPDVLSTIFGTRMEFAPDTTWVTPVCGSCREVLDLKPNFDAPEWESAMELTRRSVARSQGRWLTGYTDLHPNADLVSALVGPQNLCLELADDPEAVRAAIEHVTPFAIEAWERAIAPMQDVGQPLTTWLTATCEGRMHVPSCDFNALISPDAFRHVVFPSILEEARRADRAIFHLDGPSALVHLDTILRSPTIHAVQWVYGAGNGPAIRWTEVYRQIQAAGRAMMVLCESAEDAFALARALRPQGVWYAIGESFPANEASEIAARLRGG